MEERIKIFTGGAQKGEEDNSFSPLEDAVNMWISENPKIKIIDRKVSVATGTTRGMTDTGGIPVLEAFVNCTIVLFYREIEL